MKPPLELTKDDFIRLLNKKVKIVLVDPEDNKSTINFNKELTGYMTEIGLAINYPNRPVIIRLKTDINNQCSENDIDSGIVKELYIFKIKSIEEMTEFS